MVSQMKLEDLTSQQKAVLEGVQEWYRQKLKPVCYVAGFAGTGKTTLAKYFAQHIKGRVCFAAFTGKAAKVLRSKGCPDATTLHSLIYKAKSRSQKKLLELREQLEAATPDQKLKLEIEIREEQERANRPAFDLDENATLKGADLLILDECSMISQRLAEDALKFGVPILVLGDPAQLPPVKGAGYFTNHEPDFLLTEIHRQAKDSPVLELATKIREGLDWEYDKIMLTPELLLEADQILVGKNETRRKVNRWLRKLQGREGMYPVLGDKLVCLKNDHDQGLLNGMILTATSNCDEVGGDLCLTVKEEGEESSQDVVAIGEHFQRYTNPNFVDHRTYWDRKDLVELDYAYALTVHKAQGSQWENVLLLDDGFGYDPLTRKRWLYTAVTRASKQITILRVTGQKLG